VTPLRRIVWFSASRTICAANGMTGSHDDVLTNTSQQCHSRRRRTEAAGRGGGGRAVGPCRCGRANAPRAKKAAGKRREFGAASVARSPSLRSGLPLRDLGRTRRGVYGLDHLGVVHGVVADAGLYLGRLAQLLVSDPHRELSDRYVNLVIFGCGFRAADDGAGACCWRCCSISACAGRSAAHDLSLSARSLLCGDGHVWSWLLNPGSAFSAWCESRLDRFPLRLAGAVGQGDFTP